MQKQDQRALAHLGDVEPGSVRRHVAMGPRSLDPDDLLGVEEGHGAGTVTALSVAGARADPGLAEAVIPDRDALVFSTPPMAR